MAEVKHENVRQVVRNAAVAMQQLAQSIAELENNLIAMNAFDDLITRGQANPLQQLDMIFQMSEEMTNLLSRLADQVSDNDQIALPNLVAPIRLERLRAVFEQETTPSQTTNNNRASSIMLF